MAVEKQAINLNFAQGLDLKTDPNQVQAGRFLQLNNAVFQNGGGLQKRNGFGFYSNTGLTTQTSLLTHNDSLLAAGPSLYSYAADVGRWYNQGKVQPIDVATKSLIRNSTSQTKIDSCTASNGLVCTVYMEGSNSYYSIIDASTGQSVVSRTQLAATSVNPRVICLGNYFIILCGTTVTATPCITYLAIPITNPSSPGTQTTLVNTIYSITSAYDAVVTNNRLYVAFKGNDGGGAIRLVYMSLSFTISSQTIIASYVADYICITADESGNLPNIWVAIWDAVSTNIYAFCRNSNLVSVLGVTTISTGKTVTSLTGAATGNVFTIIYQNSNTYSYNSVRTDYLTYKTVNLSASVSSETTICRGVGLASKAYFINDTIYLTAIQDSSYQPTLFTMDLTGSIYAKLAYQNAGSYASTFVLPSISIDNNSAQFCYLFKTQLIPVNKEQGVTAVGGIYSQVGINLATLTFNDEIVSSSEISESLHFTGGITWMYDGVKPVELGFHIYPENLKTTVSGAGGSMTAQQYYYVAVYEWTDASGNLHRSAPSIPIGALTATGTSSVSLDIPTLRQTYKTGQNPIRIVLYRWSTAQQIFYQVSSITSPTLNDTTIDSVTYSDTVADSSILGNSILYTTGDVVENIAPPASCGTALFKNRLFLINSENRNVLSFSKVIVQGEPVEMSDLFTLYIAPTTGAQGSTGETIAISAMDDKLIIFKRDAIYYIAGSGPDATGANDDFSEPVFISSAVGCSNPKSIVLTPQGLMFKSDKGIWLLGRDLSTKYIGADVEGYNAYNINSALCIPGTNQVRFVLENGTILMYDYFYAQWGSFSGFSPISATLYDGYMTCLDANGVVTKETPNQYLDNGRPVLLSFTTAWIKLTNLQGYQRAYFIYLLSNYLTPHKLIVNISYDYQNAIQQTSVISPDNYGGYYGSDSLYGGSEVYGGNSSLEQWRIFLQKQKCESIQLNISELYDASYNVTAGAGLTMSGINMVIGAKSGYPRINAKNSVG
jgi:hypothetical protein